jgi:HAD superfamily hydrolase (TIGR01509 family)
MSNLKAVIFGAIGVVAETSDVQRQAFNAAFAEAGIDWDWDRETYRRLLAINGGQERIRAFGGEQTPLRPLTDDLIAALHERKTAIYGKMLQSGAVAPRAGVTALIEACQLAGVAVAFCTSTSRENVDAIRVALGSQLDFAVFDTIVTIDKIARVKPAPDAYLHCLAALGVAADEAIAIEDTPVSMASALTAGLAVIATPGAMTDDQDFSGAALVVPDLTGVSIAQIEELLRARVGQVLLGNP